MSGSSDTPPEGAVRVEAPPSWWSGAPAGSCEEPFVFPRVWGGAGTCGPATGQGTAPAAAQTAVGGLGVEVQPPARPQPPAAPSGGQDPQPAQPPQPEPETLLERIKRWWSSPIHQAPSPGPKWLGALLLAWQAKTSAVTGAGTGAEAAGGAL